MRPLQPWSSILLVLLFILVVYPTAKIIATGSNTNSIIAWNELNDYPQPECIYLSFYAVPCNLPKYVACVVVRSVQRLRRFTIACVNITISETTGLLPSPSWALPPLSIGASHSTWSRSFSATEPENQECDDLADPGEKQACISKTTQHDVTYVIIAGIVVVLACIGFGALMFRYVRREKALVSKNDPPANMVGLGRGLGSDAVDVRSSASGKSDLKRDYDKDLEGNNDELIASTWRVPGRQNSSAWRRLLRGNQSASVELVENGFLAPPIAQIPPRIPTPALPSTAIYLSDSMRARMGLQRKPLNGLAAFQDDDFVVPRGLVVPEIRVISAGSY